MNTTRRVRLLLSVLFIGLALPASAQWRVTAGVKAWAPTWNLTIARESGVEQSDYSPALMTGPYVMLRYSDVSLTGYYTASLRHFEATAVNPGSYTMGFAGTRLVSRQDVNLLLQYAVTPEFSLFGTAKFLTYELHDALSYINGMQGKFRQTFRGTGFGGGVNIGMPFSGRSRFYAFLSAGALANAYRSDDAVATLIYGGQSVEVPVANGGAGNGAGSDTGSELLYFLDAGVGYLIPGSNAGISAGLRVENGKSTKTILGPTLSLFYSF
jgi:hypothetical protein